MFVAIVQITLANGSEDDLMRHIKETNPSLAKIDGFVSRKLLKSDDGSLRLLVEHQSRETFQQMHQNPLHEKVRNKLFEIIAPNVTRTFCTVLS